MNRLLLLSLVLTLLGCGPSTLLRSHAYDGPQKPKSELATVYVAHQGVDTYHATICQVDGKSYSRFGLTTDCPSVVYVVPGQHKVALKTIFGYLIGIHELDIDVVAGRVYEILMTPKTRNSVVYSVALKAPEFVLMYSHIAPRGYQGTNLEDGVVPFSPN